MASKPRVLILGAGFGGMELASILSSTFGDGVDVTLIDKNDDFVFGYSKLDVLFHREAPEAVRLPYRNFVKPGVRLLKRTVTAIDAEARRVETDGGVFEADYLVVALGADYDLAATPGLADATEFYSVGGATRMRDLMPGFTRGHAIIGVCGAPFKCPPAPSECALMLHDYLAAQGVRQNCDITLILPLPSPVPPSPDTSAALLAAFAERNIRFVPGRRVVSIDNARQLAICDDGSTYPFDLFLGVPKHRVPQVVIDSGMAEDGWIPVNPRTLETRFERVYAVGDCAATGTPKAGVFAEGAAAAVASALVSALGAGGTVTPYDGRGTCYVEFGTGRVAKVEVDFFSAPKPTGQFHAASDALRLDKEHFGSSRRQRWFGAAI